MRYIAVDWSGAQSTSAQRTHIWSAVLSPPESRLVGGRTRDEVVDWLITERSRHPAMLVGLDFAFSFPEWYVSQHATNAPDFWRYLVANCEDLLACRQQPFWGRGANRRPPPSAWIVDRGLRDTDRAIRIRGQHPKSAFQVNYPGAVGTGSLRGAACLLRLRDAGFAIWPFDPAGSHTVVEIYPRLFTGETNVSSPDARRAFLSQSRFSGMPGQVRRAACNSPDAFDALVAVHGMRDESAAFRRAALQRSANDLLEGRIFAQA